MARQSKGQSNRARENGNNGNNDSEFTGDFAGFGGGGIGDPGLVDFAQPGTTGRYLVLLREDAVQEGVAMLQESAGLSVASTKDTEDGILSDEQIAGSDAIVFDKLGVAVVSAPPEQMVRLAADGESPILAMEPERIVYAFDVMAPGGAFSTLPGTETVPYYPAGANDAPYGAPYAQTTSAIPAEYLQGYRDAVDHLIDRLLGEEQVADGLGAIGGQAIDESELTWGLQATKVAASRFTGKGIKVAVLDTGLDLGHPDFVGRKIVTKSFIAGEAVQDGHGHGTHCIGTACGSQRPGRLPRYGIAYEAEIFAGKVLSNRGSGADGGILAGINWAVTNGCQIVSMSLGAATQPGQSFSRVYEQAASRALAAGTLIIAAAGNESQRPGLISPVGHPANCPSIMAVGALDSKLKVAPFSCGGLTGSGGQVDIAGPGVNVYSSWPRPLLYRTISGTSMATPHVAGIAALFAQVNRAYRGRILAQLLMQNARRLSLPVRDVGIGLAQAR